MRSATQTQQTELWNLLKNINTCVFTSQTRQGLLRSRPMTSLQADFNGDLWFFTNSHAHKVEEIFSNHQVNLAYSDLENQIFVSISGTASMNYDRNKMEELWKLKPGAWLSCTEDECELALIKVAVEKADAWDTRTGGMTEIYRIAENLPIEASSGSGIDENSVQI